VAVSLAGRRAKAKLSATVLGEQGIRRKASLSSWDVAMKKTFLFLTATSAGFLAAMMTREAHAVGPLDIEVAPKFGYGSNPGSGGFGFDALSIGLGGRAGVSIFGIYGGINVVDYLGGTQPLFPCPTPGEVGCGGGASGHTLMYGGEFGYGFKLKLVTIRPQMGVGRSVAYGLAQNGGLYLEPGVTVLLSLGLVFLGFDANLAFFPDATETVDDSETVHTGLTLAFTFHLQTGVRF
jgi:hypothetical protein